MRILTVIILVVMIYAWGTRDERAEEPPIQTYRGETKQAAAPVTTGVLLEVAIG